jgi:uncharacterized membrane protein
MKIQIIYNFFTDDDLLRISNKIKEQEKLTSGEICVSIKETKPFLNRWSDIQSLAEKEFYRLGIHKTRDKTGILIFMLLKERQFYILADEGINNKVDPDTWDTLRNNMKEKFSRGEFCRGIIFGIEEIGKVLSKHFPIKPDDYNELSNKVVIK